MISLWKFFEFLLWLFTILLRLFYVFIYFYYSRQSSIIALDFSVFSYNPAAGLSSFFPGTHEPGAPGSSLSWFLLALPQPLLASSVFLGHDGIVSATQPWASCSLAGQAAPPPLTSARPAPRAACPATLSPLSQPLSHFLPGHLRQPQVPRVLIWLYQPHCPGLERRVFKGGVLHLLSWCLEHCLEHSKCSINAWCFHNSSSWEKPTQFLSTGL